jgi:hypothetical protein
LDRAMASIPSSTVFLAIRRTIRTVLQHNVTSSTSFFDNQTYYFLCVKLVDLCPLAGRRETSMHQGSK